MDDLCVAIPDDANPITPRALFKYISENKKKKKKRLSQIKRKRKEKKEKKRADDECCVCLQKREE